MSRTRFALTTPVLLFLALFLMACDIDVVPESATNVVGTTHELTATEDLEEFCEEEELPCEQWFPFFVVIAGPGEGENSTGCDIFEEDSEACFMELVECLFLEADPEECHPDADSCNPAGCVADLGDPISWTYRNDGEPGTDYIAACSFPVGFEATFPPEQFLAQSLQVEGEDPIDEELAALIEEIEEQGCDVVTKTWVDPAPTPRPSLGPLLGGVIIGGNSQVGQQTQPAPVQQQAAPTAIRPPSTGDAGLQ
jgi:hypothetical protein